MLVKYKNTKINEIKDPINEAISQHLRNQQEDGIRGLYQYSNLVLSLAVNEARYATTATSVEFPRVCEKGSTRK